MSTHVYAYVLLLGRFIPIAVDLHLFNPHNPLNSRVKFNDALAGRTNFTAYERANQFHNEFSGRVEVTSHSIRSSKNFRPGNGYKTHDSKVFVFRRLVLVQAFASSINRRTKHGAQAKYTTRLPAELVHVRIDTTRFNEL